MTFDRNNKNLWHDIHTGNWCQKLYMTSKWHTCLEKAQLILKIQNLAQEDTKLIFKGRYCMQTENNFEKDTFNYQ